MQPIITTSQGNELRFDGIFFENREWWYKFQIVSKNSEREFPVCPYRIPTRDDFNMVAQEYGIEIICSDAEYDEFLSDCRNCEIKIREKLLKEVPRDQLCDFVFEIKFPRYPEFKHLSQMQ